VGSPPNSFDRRARRDRQRMTWGLQIADDQQSRRLGSNPWVAPTEASIADTTAENNPTPAATSPSASLIRTNRLGVLAGATASGNDSRGDSRAEKSEIPMVTNSYSDGIVTRGYKYTSIPRRAAAVGSWSMRALRFGGVEGIPPNRR